MTFKYKLKILQLNFGNKIVDKMVDKVDKIMDGIANRW